MMLKLRKIMLLLCVLVVGTASAELFIHLDGSTNDSADPNNLGFKDQAKDNDAIPINLQYPDLEKGLGNVLQVHQTAFGGVGDEGMYFGPSETRAAMVPGNDPHFDRSYSELTISFWYKPNKEADTLPNYLMGKMGGGGNRGWQILRSDDSGNPGEIKMMYFDGPSGANTTPVFSDMNVTPALFTHIAITFEAGVAVKGFRNGVEIVSTGALSAFNGANNAPFEVGNRGSIAKRSADGILDDVGLWDEVLDAQEIASIHALGYFEDLNLQDPLIDEFLAAFAQQQPVNIGCNVWEYASGYSTTVGQTGGSVAACNAYVVLDSSGNGMRLTSCGNDIEGDLTNDCNVDILDYSVLADQWLSSNLP